MAKIILPDLTNLQNEATVIAMLASNNTAIENAVENTLSRDGTSPNQMGADLDMNGNSILNLPFPASPTEPLRLGDIGDSLPTIIIQTDTPATAFQEGTLWIDSDSANQDLYQLTSGVWVDTGVNVKGTNGTNGTTGPAAWTTVAAWLTATAYVTGPPASVVTQGGETYVCIVAHTSGTFATDLAALKWIKVAAKGTDGAGTGDVVGPAASLDGEAVLFNSTTGKLIKRSTLTGLIKQTSGVASVATAGTDYYNPGGTDVAVLDGGTGSSTAPGARTNLGLVIGTDVLAYDAQLSSLIRQNSQSAAYTLVLTDGGKHVLHPSADTTARIFTIPANSSVAFPIGTAVTFVNQNAGGVITISITTDTMRIAGAGTTGSRTLAANGIATALKITSTEWIISGTGLT